MLSPFQSSLGWPPWNPLFQQPSPQEFSLGTAWTLPMYIFIYGELAPPHARAAQCLNRWKMAGSKLWSGLRSLVSVHNQTVASDWAAPLNPHYRLKQGLAGRIHGSRFLSFGRSLLLQLGVSGNEAIVRNLSLTLREISGSTSEAVAAEQRSLNLLTKVVLDKRIVLDSSLAEQGGVCSIANTFCA